MTMDHETFQQLLDEATGTAPPAPPVAIDLAAGRTRLLRRRLGATGAGVVAVAVFAIAASGVLAGSPRGADEPSRFATQDPSVVQTPDTTDSQVLRDVIDAAFPIPGDAQLRNIRVQTFLRGWGILRCGGKPAPPDSTADRFEQDLFPSLSLIRERGFAEPTQESFDGFREHCQIGDKLAANASAWQDWRELVGPWLELADGVLRDEDLVAPRQSMAQCLRQATGLEISGEDPAGSLLSAVDGAGTRGAVDQDLQMERAAAYADCGAGYFGRFEELLLEARPAFVEEHRELLERFARQITTLGYVP
jgi:hypothetical protein